MQSTYMRPVRHAEVYSEARKEARQVEALGFDTLWMGEHHMSYDGYCPSLLPAAAGLLANTDQLRVSTGVLVLPFHDADRVTEGHRALQSLSNNRFRLTLGIGYRQVEFASAGLKVSDRVRLVDQRLAQLREDERQERLGPVDMWMGTAAVNGVVRAARHGCSVLLQPTVTSSKIPELKQHWEENLVVLPGTKPRFGIMRETWVDSDPAVVDWARGRLTEMWRHYSNFSFNDPVARRADRDQAADQMTRLGVFGSASEVVDRLGRLIEAGVDTVAVRIRFDGVTGAALQRCLEGFAADVMPQLRGAA